MSDWWIDIITVSWKIKHAHIVWEENVVKKIDIINSVEKKIDDYKASNVFITESSVEPYSNARLPNIAYIWNEESLKQIYILHLNVKVSIWISHYINCVSFFIVIINLVQ